MTQTNLDSIPTHDFRGVLCPLNFVRTKIELEKVAPGAIIRVLIDSGEPLANVPRSVLLEGHSLEEQVDLGDYWQLTIRRKG